jgi:hypothetical protein
MIRARYILAATVTSASLIGVSVLAAQAPQAPPMSPILAGKKFTPPVKGDASVDFIPAATPREGQTLVTKIQVKNTMNAPIARLKIAETWYDKAGNPIPGGDATIDGLLQAGDVKTLEIRTPVNKDMTASKLQFTHANGPINKPHRVTKFDGGADAAPPAKTAAAKKPAARKK